MTNIFANELTNITYAFRRNTDTQEKQSLHLWPKFLTTKHLNVNELVVMHSQLEETYGAKSLQCRDNILLFCKGRRCYWSLLSKSVLLLFQVNELNYFTKWANCAGNPPQKTHIQILGVLLLEGFYCEACLTQLQTHNKHSVSLSPNAYLQQKMVTM